VNPTPRVPSATFSRRQIIRRSAGLAAWGTVALTQPGWASAGEARRPAVTKGRIKQSLVPWCWQDCGDKWSFEKICQVARELGCASVELTDPKNYPTIQRYGLTCAIAQIDLNPDPPFLKGFNNPDHWPRVIQASQDAIDAAAAFGCPSVICFTGYSAKDPKDPNSPQIPRDVGAKNCVEGLKKVVGYAEKKHITLCLEMLNTRDDTHPMKGHPGYQGDHTDYCVNDILKPVGSPRLKLLFDIYHVQVMDGDVIRRIHQHKDHLGHVHVAGCPGRGEPDRTQELNFPACMQALLEVGYRGYVGQEFIPTRDPHQGLVEAVTLCDV